MKPTSSTHSVRRVTNIWLSMRRIGGATKAKRLKKSIAFRRPKQLESAHVTHHLVDYCRFHCRLVRARGPARSATSRIRADHGARHRRIHCRRIDRANLFQTSARIRVSPRRLYYVGDLRDSLALALGEVRRRSGLRKTKSKLLS